VHAVDAATGGEFVVGVDYDWVGVDPQDLVVAGEGAVGQDDVGVVVAAAQLAEGVAGVVVVTVDEGVAVVGER